MLSESNLLDRLYQHAKNHGDDLAFSLLAEPVTNLSFSQLINNAEQFAAAMQTLCQPGDRIMIALPTSLEYIELIVACWIAGLIPVPFFPPNRRQVDRFRGVYQDCGACFAVTKPGGLPDLNAVKQRDVDSLKNLAIGKDLQKAQMAELALIQYTSGSIADPKGVMVTHSNVVANMLTIEQAFATDKNTRFVSWLPLFHDMGLIGNIFHPMYLGIPCGLLSPQQFVGRPFSWLQAISDFKATISGGPNFAYALCSDKITPEQKSKLDLSQWRVAYCGSEPIRAETLKDFYHSFKAQGLQEKALHPCYGLAESTLFVTSPSVQDLLHSEEKLLSGQSIPSRVVNCGKSWQQQTLLIVEPKSKQICEYGEVGEVWVKSASVAKGYWQKPELSQQVFQAFTNNGDGPFLRTGDVGFLFKDNLYLVGRLKDMLIIRGVNHYPEDLEHTISRADNALNHMANAVFIDDEQQLIVLQELTRNSHHHDDKQLLTKQIQQLLSESHGLTAKEIIFLKPFEIPRTTSGKVRRSKAKKWYLSQKVVLS